MKAIRPFAFTFVFIILLALIPFTAFAAGDLPPAPTWSDLMNATIAQGIAWLIAFGVTAAVSYALNQFPQLDAKIKTTIGGVVTAMLVAGVTALGALVPQQWMDKTIFEAAIAFLTLLVNTAGHYFGSLKGQEHYVARVDVRQRIAAMRLPVLALLLGGALALSLLALSTPAPAYAETPLPDFQPWMAAAVQYTGLGSIQGVQLAFKRYQDSQAEFHQWTTKEMWHGNYAATVTEFLRQHGCVSCSIDGVIQSPKLRIDIPVGMRDLGILFPD